MGISMQIQTAISQLINREDLSLDEMQGVMRQIMTGECSDAQIAGFLIALRMKGECVEEIQGGAEIMRELSTKVAADSEYLVDTCGTGGDGSQLFNVSTASAFVAAAAGARVAKHGNRSVSSKSGSADLLEAAGVKLDLSPEQVGKCIAEIGIGFMFAPAHHGAMKHAIGPRKELATRTIFNLLGPLTNPAAAPNQLLGVFDRAWLRPLAEVLQRLGSDHVMVVHSSDGLDEISASAVTYVCELREGEISEYKISPEDFGITPVSLQSLSAVDPETSLKLVKQGISELESAAANIVSLNAGASIYVSGVADSLAEGVAMAQDAIASGLAKNKLAELIDFSAALKDVE
jgi:anthranilate phosphoribosyltransferase